MIEKAISQQLLNCKNWIFDMDGTLTVANHDFDAIRKDLGLPEGLPILESLEVLPVEESESLHKRLNQIELEIAAESKPAEGAKALLEILLSRKANLGILTRNNKMNIEVTLKAAGLYSYFQDENLLSRDCIKPKPAPDGIQYLLEKWGGVVSDAVMVGDHLHDLLSGKAAGVKTLYVDPQGEFVFKATPKGRIADVCVNNLTELFV